MHMTTAGGAPSGHGDYPGTPRWVKVFAVATVALVVVVVVLVLVGGHGAGLHNPLGGGHGG
jgi:hypothetical protein